MEVLLCVLLMLSTSVGGATAIFVLQSYDNGKVQMTGSQAALLVIGLPGSVFVSVLMCVFYAAFCLWDRITRRWGKTVFRVRIPFTSRDQA